MPYLIRYHIESQPGFSFHAFRSLPIGMQIIGRPFDEPGVLRIGSVFEAATDLANTTPTGRG